MDSGFNAQTVSAAASVIGIIVQIWAIERQRVAAQNQNHGVSLIPSVLLAAIGASTILSSVYSPDWRMAVLAASVGSVACSVGLILSFMVMLHNGVMKLIDKRIADIDRRLG